MRAANDMASFDSASSMFYTLASYLHGRSHAKAGLSHRALTPLVTNLAKALNHLSRPAREALYTAGGGGEAISPRKLSSVDPERLASVVVDEYPRRQYQAIAIGSANGALIHLCAALGMPWLPQTMLLPIRRTGVDPTEPRQELEWSQEHGRRLLAQNPDLQLHDMIDPLHDLPMSKAMSYFRVKRLRLGATYEHFVRDSLQPGGTIIIVDCRLKWPTTKVGERFYFQFGGLGGATVQEFFEGSQRVREYLRHQGYGKDRFNPPPPDGESPESQWGFEPQLADDIERFAARYGFAVRRLSFDRPEHLSPLVADFFRWCYERRSVRCSRLFAQSFLLIEPYWTARAGAIPYWLAFSTQPFDSQLEQYIREAGPFDEIALTLFGDGVQSVGHVSPDRWRQIVDMASDRGELAGVDERRFPPAEAMTRYQSRVAEIFDARYALPGPACLGEFDQFHRQNWSRYPVTLDMIATSRRRAA